MHLLILMKLLVLLLLVLLSSLLLLLMMMMKMSYQNCSDNPVNHHNPERGLIPLQK